MGFFVDQGTIEQLVSLALAEDIGSGDITAQLIPANEHSVATIIAREAAVICGRSFANEVFRQLDPSVCLEWHVEDASLVKENDVLCTLKGKARSLLTGERTALNFLQTLSATATSTRSFVNTIGSHKAKLLDTRKTIPNLRLAQKYAVTCGGGHNHRVGLYDAFLIKENHIYAAGSIEKAVEAARKLSPNLLLEVEVETFKQLDEAISCGVKRVLLDNFSLADLEKAVKIAGSQADLEASGNINLETIEKVARTGVDFISTGAITKHIAAIDLSMRFKA
jgi:nicotinate-nucleotide pyrophosphorylase (carboxylating)